MSGNNCRLCAGKFAFALGLIWGLSVLLLGWFGWLWAYGIPMIALVSTVYLGYAPTFVGGIIGGVWGFVDFFIFGLLLAWIYNGCCGKCKSAE